MKPIHTYFNPRPRSPNNERYQDIHAPNWEEGASSTFYPPSYLGWQVVFLLF